MDTPDLKEAAELVDRLSKSLPVKIDLEVQVRRFKLAGKALILREGLIWRAEELGRSAVDSFRRDDVVAGSTLTRALMETTAALIALHDIVERGLKEGVTRALDNELLGFLTGSKVWEELPGAKAVKRLCARADKVLPHFNDGYGMLSEVAHPNWSGVQGSYCATDEKNLIINLARGAHGDRGAINLLVASAGVFIAYYERLSGLFPAFVDASEEWVAKLDAAR